MDSKQCHVCGEVFMNISVVMSHISTHSRKEIYDCLVVFKSSLEIFMKQYYALKKYVNSKSSTTMDNNNSNDGNNESLNFHEDQPTLQDHTENQDFTFISERNMQVRPQIPQSDVIDLTDVEIKKEVDPTDEQYIQNCSEMSENRGDNPCQNVRGDNSTKEQKGLSVIDLSYAGPGDNALKKESNQGTQYPVFQNGTQPMESQQSNLEDESAETYRKNVLLQFKRNQTCNNRDTNLQLSPSMLQKIAEKMKLNVSQGITDTTCTQCGRTFATKFVLRRHMMSHTGERTHACPICGKGFIGKQNMMVHIRVHTGEKPYKCSSCGQQFSQYGTLYRHKKRHVNNGDLKGTASF